jgi:hypothetical protein
MLEELLSIKEVKQSKTELIEKVVDELISRDAFIDSCDYVLNEINIRAAVNLTAIPVH